MTAQEVYDKVKGHLLTQNARCEDDSQCLYRQGNNKCAVGALIPDICYVPSFEGKLVDDLIAKYGSRTVFGEDEMEKHLFLMIQLQKIHDNSPIPLWERDLRYVAENFGLQP